MLFINQHDQKSIDIAEDEKSVDNKDEDHIKKTDKTRGLNMDQSVKLPIVFHEREIMENILSNPVTIFCGETGSGKSTQLP